MHPKATIGYSLLDPVVGTCLGFGLKYTYLPVCTGDGKHHRVVVRVVKAVKVSIDRLTKEADIVVVVGRIPMVRSLELNDRWMT